MYYMQQLFGPSTFKSLDLTPLPYKKSYICNYQKKH